MRYLFSPLLSLLLFTPIAAQLPIQNTHGGSSDQQLKVVLDEVRELRALVKTLITANLQAQVTLAEYRLRQEKVAGLERELRGAQDQLSMLGETIGQLVKVEEVLEKKLSDETDPDRRLEIEQQRLAALENSEQAKRQDRRLRERETDIEIAVAKERAILADLQDRLWALQRIAQSSNP